MQALTFEDMEQLEVTQMRMLRSIMHISLKEHLTNVEIRQRAGVKAVTDLLRERRLGWFGKVMEMAMERWPKAVLCGSFHWQIWERDHRVIPTSDGHTWCGRMCRM